MNTIERLVEIVRKNSTGYFDTNVQPRTCWLDGDECPYGRPNGKFNDRPRIFCVIPTDSGSGCDKLSDIIDDLDEIQDNWMKTEIERRMCQKFKENQTNLEGELRTMAHGLGKVEKEILELAADIVKKLSCMKK